MPTSEIVPPPGYREGAINNKRYFRPKSTASKQTAIIKTRQTKQVSEVDDQDSKARPGKSEKADLQPTAPQVQVEDTSTKTIDAQ